MSLYVSRMKYMNVKFVVLRMWTIFITFTMNVYDANPCNRFWNVYFYLSMNKHSFTNIHYLPSSMLMSINVGDWCVHRLCCDSKTFSKQWHLMLMSNSSKKCRPSFDRLFVAVNGTTGALILFTAKALNIFRVWIRLEP